jgi:hypothetical protein
MVRPTFNRRGALKGAGGIGAGVAAALAAHTALAREEDAASRDLAGGWEVTGTLTSGVSTKLLVVFAAGGGVVRSHQNDLSPSSLASPSYGSWMRLGNGEFGITVRNFRYNPNGTLVGTTKIRVRATLNDAADQFSGRGETQFLDLNGNVTAMIASTVDGRRIRVELPDSV